MGKGLFYRLAICGLAAVSLAGPSLAQDEDDWELVQVADTATTMAVARYDSGLAIAVRCTARNLSVMVQGLPPSTETSRFLEHEVIGVGKEDGTWNLSADGRVAFSTAPKRHARSLIGGGTLRLTLKDQQDQPIHFQVDLPSQSRSLEASLAACDLKPVDERLPRRADLFVPDRLPAWEWHKLVSPDYPSPTRSTTGQARLLCQIDAAGRLHSCEIESESPPGQGFGSAVMAAHRSGQFRSVDPDHPLVENSFISFTTRFKLK